MRHFYGIRKIITSTLLIASTGLALARCSDDGAKNRPDPKGAPQAVPEPQDDTPEAQAEPPPATTTPSGDERQFTQTELMTLVGLSTTQSQTAYGHCRDVLAQGVYDRYKDDVSDTVKHALTERFCAMADDEFAEKVQTYYKEGRAGSNSATGSDSFGFSYMNTIGLNVATSHGGSSSSSQEITRAEALETVKNWHEEHCGESSQAQSSDFEHTVVSEQIDENVIAAWRSCVTQASHGFFCESSETDDTVSVHLRWDPNAVQATLLPRLSLRQQTAHNLELSSTAMPDTLGTGSGVSVTYKRVDPDKPSVFEAQGSDGAKQVDFNCSIQVSKVVRGHNKEAETCGLKEFKLGSGDVCGVASYKTGTGPVCGTTYKTRASAACGVDLYKEGPDSACPGYVSPDTQTKNENAAACTGDAREPATCPEGYMDMGVSNETHACQSHGRIADVDWTQIISKTRTCRRAEFMTSCRLPRFGVERYKTCAHASHGVDHYDSCAHPSFGTNFKSCRSESFGKTFNTCFVPD